MRAEILIDPGMSQKGQRMLRAMVEAAPIPVSVGEFYRGRAEILMVYGNGHPVRRRWWVEHRRRGGRCVGWDLGYWGRDQQLMRMTVDHDHPQRMLRPEPDFRWDAQGIDLREDAADGPAMVVGLGPKSCRALGLKYGEWERATITRLQREGRRVVFRPKRETDVLRGIENVSGPIEEALQGKSLVVCRHSNVAVDACIAGVPVQCEDGAAYALYSKGPAPTTDQRLEFLRSLAWWNWHATEAEEAWKYLISRLS